MNQLFDADDNRKRYTPDVWQAMKVYDNNRKPRPAHIAARVARNRVYINVRDAAAGAVGIKLSYPVALNLTQAHGAAICRPLF